MKTHIDLKRDFCSSRGACKIEANFEPSQSCHRHVSSLICIEKIETRTFQIIYFILLFFPGKTNFLWTRKRQKLRIKMVVTKLQALQLYNKLNSLWATNSQNGFDVIFAQNSVVLKWTPPFKNRQKWCDFSLQSIKFLFVKHSQVGKYAESCTFKSYG